MWRSGSNSPNIHLKVLIIDKKKLSCLIDDLKWLNVHSKNIRKNKIHINDQRIKMVVPKSFDFIKRTCSCLDNQAYTYNLLEKNQLIKLPNIIYIFHNNFVLMCKKLFTFFPLKPQSNSLEYQWTENILLVENDRFNVQFETATLDRGAVICAKWLTETTKWTIRVQCALYANFLRASFLVENRLYWCRRNSSHRVRGRTLWPKMLDISC